jgi:anti-sigma regulatory factor (Ser/Thr protein kinase)
VELDDAPGDSLVLTLNRDSNAPSIARRRTVAAVDHAVDGRRRADLELLVSEIVSNAVLHGQGEITLVVWLANGHVHVQVSDEGNELPRQQPSTGAHGGFGLRLLEQLSVDWGVDSDADGKTVWFRL